MFQFKSLQYEKILATDLSLNIPAGVLISTLIFVCVCVQIPEENLFHCRVLYEDSVYAPLRGRQELEENVGIYLADNYEKITVPVPHFGGSDPADIIHDFHRVRTYTHTHTFDMSSLCREHTMQYPVKQ